MIRYSNRFKAGTRRNKRWAKTAGPDRHQSLISDFEKCGFTKECCSLRINPGKPNHMARVANLDWKALKDAERKVQEENEAVANVIKQGGDATMFGVKQ